MAKAAPKGLPLRLLRSRATTATSASSPLQVGQAEVRLPHEPGQHDQGLSSCGPLPADGLASPELQGLSASKTALVGVHAAAAEDGVLGGPHNPLPCEKLVPFLGMHVEKGVDGKRLKFLRNVRAPVCKAKAALKPLTGWCALQERPRRSVSCSQLSLAALFSGRATATQGPCMGSVIAAGY